MPIRDAHQYDIRRERQSPSTTPWDNGVSSIIEYYGYPEQITTAIQLCDYLEKHREKDADGKMKKVWKFLDPDDDSRSHGRLAPAWELAMPDTGAIMITNKGWQISPPGKDWGIPEGRSRLLGFYILATETEYTLADYWNNVIEYREMTNPIHRKVKKVDSDIIAVRLLGHKYFENQQQIRG